MNRRVLGVDAVLAVGVLALLVAAAVVVVPWLVPAATVGALLGPLATKPAVILLGVVAGLLGLRTVYRGESRGDDPAVALPAPPAEREREREGDVRTAGRGVDDLLERIGSATGDGTKVDRLIDKGKVRDHVYATAVDVLVDTGGYAPEEAREHVDRGTWTDRPRAAAFLGEDAPGLPLEVRIRDWLSGEAFERQVRATVEELADIAGVETGPGMAPPPVSLEDAAGPRTAGTGADARPGEAPPTDARASPDAPEPEPDAVGEGAAVAGADQTGGGGPDDRGGVPGPANGTTTVPREAGGDEEGEAAAGPEAGGERELATEGDPR